MAWDKFSFGAGMLAGAALVSAGLVIAGLSINKKLEKDIRKINAQTKKIEKERERIEAKAKRLRAELESLERAQSRSLRHRGHRGGSQSN